ncbi:PH domain-containing protein [Microbacterium ulmi]|uniref:PH domain-containing protein n=2 Tax=Microbacterium ulmi TaxID=179095 RepID=A0A7Y2PYE4_9MICO|nr:PH domain-containing protein [Microbacterium ulmi]
MPDGAPPHTPGSPTHAPDSTPTTTDAAGAVQQETDAEAPPAALDDGTFTRLAEPGSANRLELEQGVWHQVSRKYVWVQLISSGIVLILSVVAVLVVALALGQTWAWIPGGIWIVILVWTIAIMPRQARAIGYQLRDDDLVFRRGILWQRMVAVPYGRMQLVDITHGPLDRGFGIAQLKFVTAAASTGVVIPGLPQPTAESLRDHLVAVAESRRTGL